MKKLIRILLVTDIKEYGNKTVELESLYSLHELEIYTILESMFPAFIKINYNDVNSLDGYSYQYKNGLKTVVIYRAN